MTRIVMIAMFAICGLLAAVQGRTSPPHTAAAASTGVTVSAALTAPAAGQTEEACDGSTLLEDAASCAGDGTWSSDGCCTGPLMQQRYSNGVTSKCCGRCID